MYRDKKIPLPLIRLLADQALHSGEDIGMALGISRAAVWKQLHGIQALGLRIQSSRGLGYRLLDRIDLLDANYLEQGLSDRYGARCQIFHEIDSTNSFLLRLLQTENLDSGYCVAAELQTAGRGRRGKSWRSPFAKNLYFSVLWNFDEGMSGMEGLSLVVGISIAQALQSIGVNDAQLKWPNDVLVHTKKLAGILLEVVGDPVGLCHVVIGVGLNVYMHEHDADVIDQPWVSLDGVTDLKITRSDLLLILLDYLFANLQKFQKLGFGVFINEWHGFDAYLGREVMVVSGEQAVFGMAEGVSPSGELLVATEIGLRSFNSGEVSLRLRM